MAAVFRIRNAKLRYLLPTITTYSRIQYELRLLYTTATQLNEKTSLSIQECYMLLGLKVGDTSSSRAREEYLKLAKQYHPDSGKSTAGAEKFAKIDHAYRVVLMHVNEGEKAEGMMTEIIGKDDDDDDKFDIRHTAPQHRRFLEYGGYGTGTPSMREKQFQQHKVQSAIDKVIDHKVKQFGSDETSIAEPEKKRIRRAKISGAIERVVEDLIQEAMSKGEFSNLPGSGKPLKVDKIADPCIDSTTRRLNKVLIDTGFVPEWIAFEKEIRENKQALREFILTKRRKLGPAPLNKQMTYIWEKNMEQFGEKGRLINGKIDKLNLIVPILSRQQVHMNLQREIDRIEENYGYGEGIWSNINEISSHIFLRRQHAGWNTAIGRFALSFSGRFANNLINIFDKWGVNLRQLLLRWKSARKA